LPQAQRPRPRHRGERRGLALGDAGEGGHDAPNRAEQPMNGPPATAVERTIMPFSNDMAPRGSLLQNHADASNDDMLILS